MKTEPASARTLKHTLLYVLAYLLWLVSSAACVVAVLQLRAAVNALWVALGGNRYSLGLANQVSLLLAGFAAFVYVIFLEGYYREAVGHGASLFRRFAVTMAVPVGVIVLSLAAVEIALRLIH
jgi:hypothetical protein